MLLFYDALQSVKTKKSKQLKKIILENQIAKIGRKIVGKFLK